MIPPTDYDALIRLIGLWQGWLLKTRPPAPLIRAVQACIDAWASAPPSHADALKQLRRAFAGHVFPAVFEAEDAQDKPFDGQHRTDDPVVWRSIGKGPADLRKSIGQSAALGDQICIEQVQGHGIGVVVGDVHHNYATPQAPEPAPLKTQSSAPSEAAPDTLFSVQVSTLPSETLAKPELRAPVDARERTTVKVQLDVPDGSALSIVGPQTAWITARIGEPSAPVVLQLRGPAGTHDFAMLFIVDEQAFVHGHTIVIRPQPVPLIEPTTVAVPDGPPAAFSLVVQAREPARRTLRFALRQGSTTLAKADHHLEANIVDRLTRLVGDLRGLSTRSVRRQQNMLRTRGEALAEDCLPAAIRDALAELPPRVGLQIASEGPCLPWSLMVVDGEALGHRFAMARRPLMRPLSARLGGPVVRVDGGVRDCGRPDLLGPPEPAIATAEDLEARLRASAAPIGLLHLTAPNLAGVHVGDAPPIAIGGEQFEYKDVPRTSALDGAFVLLGICPQPGADLTLTAFAHWVDAFQKAGAAAVLAPIFPIPASTFAAFTEQVYDHLRAGDTLPEAVRSARLALDEHPILLAVTLHAHHAARWVGYSPSSPPPMVTLP